MNDNEFKNVKPGDVISAKLFNAMTRLLKRKVTGPDVQETSDGWHVRRGKEKELRILALNSSGFTIPAFAIAEVTARDSARNKFVLGRPTSDDDPNTVIVAGADIPNGKEGYIFDDKGTHQILAPGAVRDDIVGSQNGSFNGAVSADGSYLVRAVSGGDVFATPFRGQAIQVTGVIPFASYQFVDQQNPTFVQGFPLTMQISRNLDIFNPITHRGVGKFSSPITLTALTNISIVLADVKFYRFKIEKNSFPGSGDNTDGFHTINIFAITADFDETALNFNNYGSLSLSLIGSFAMQLIAQGSGPFVSAQQKEKTTSGHPSLERRLIFSGTMFGLAFESAITLTDATTGDHELQVVRTDTSGGYIVVDPFQVL